MGALIAILVIVGGWEALKDGYRHMRDSSRKPKPGTGGRRYSGNHSRSGGGGGSSARHDKTGYWASEVGHGFPHFRHGFAQGWSRHQKIRDDLYRDRQKARAEHLENRTGVVADVQEYRNRQRAAQEKIAETNTPETETDEGQSQETPLPSEQGRRRHSERLSRPASGLAPVTPITGNPESSRPPADFPGESSDTPPGDSPGDAPGGNDGKYPESQIKPGWWEQAVQEQQAGGDGSNGKGSSDDTGSSTPQEGSSEVASDTNYNEVLRQSREISEAGEQHAASVAGMRQQVEQMTDGCQAAEVDSQTLGEMADASEAWRTAEQAIKDAQDRTAAIPDSVAKRHGLLAEAHQSSPVRAAQREWYEE